MSKKSSKIQTQKNIVSEANTNLCKLLESGLISNSEFFIMLKIIEGARKAVMKEVLNHV